MLPPAALGQLSVAIPPVVLSAVNDIETLVASLSNKIWQKIMILDIALPEEMARRAPTKQLPRVSEIELDNPALAPLIEEYLRRYLEWLRKEPKSACWFDTFIIHAALRRYFWGKALHVENTSSWPNAPSV